MRSVHRIVFITMGLACLVLGALPAEAYETYRDGGENCSQCHPGFVGGFSGPLHSAHLTAVSDCAACHTTPGSAPVELASSGLGPGCTGCHLAPGLRAHHTNAGAPPDNLDLTCANCHPSDPTPAPESTFPPYYGVQAPNLDPCNGSEELTAGFTVSLDNDGDLLYDQADPDCATGCTSDAECDDGEFCNGAETCDTASGECQPGTPVDCNDGVECTVDTCNEATDSCDNLPDDGFCDNGMFCDGVETCDPQNDCQPGEPPCDPATESCDETTDSCLPLGCTSDAECDDGEFCNGAETCDTATGDCQPGTPVDCDDGVDCTLDSCDEATDSCENLPDDGFCDNGMFCDGVETCDPMLDCQPGTPVDCDDGDVCTDDSCDEDIDDCVNVPNPDNDPSCVPEIECFNDVDDDLDGFTDCADSDCEGVTGDACDTGLPGICAAGTATCAGGEETCVPDDDPAVEGPPGDGTCADGLDNDCDGLTDLDDPDCVVDRETECFDDIDNDGDGLIDCEDPDCDGSTGDACDTGEPGVCADGTLTCVNLEEVCLADDEGEPEGIDYGNCMDGLDNDCDGLTDDADPDCRIMPGEDCFDGEDNDGDGFVDCADEECEGAEDGPCDTGLPGVCADGTLVCSGGLEECRQDTLAEPEGDMYDNCRDGLDNNCDGLTDGDDPDCTMDLADVWLVKLIAHEKVQLPLGKTKRRRVFALATGDTMRQPATVTLTADFDPEALSIVIDPDSLTREVGPSTQDGYMGDGDDDDDDDDDDDGLTLFKFYPLITCNATGSYTVAWTAEIDSAENRESDGDVLTEYTVVRCRYGRSMGHHRSDDESTSRSHGTRYSVDFE